MSEKARLLQREAAWDCFVTAQNSPDLPSIENIFEAINQFPKVLKDDRRSLVKQGSLLGMQVIAKQPRDKNRRKWAQFLSMFRLAEARQTFESLISFKEQGIPSVDPICVLEKRVKRQVVDSWLIYQYRAGEPCDASSLPAMVGLLKALHANGYRHEDPTYGNFLIDPDGEMFLIDCKGKAKGGEFAAYYDYMMLSMNNPGISAEHVEALIEIDRWSPGYQLARLYRGYRNTRSRLKRRVGRYKSRDQIE